MKTIPSCLPDHRPLRIAAVIGCLALLLVLLPATAAAASKEQMLTIELKRNIKVVYDIRDDVWAAGIGKALYYARGLYEAYRKQGVPPDELHLSLVLHGAAVYWLLIDDTYQIQVNDPFAINPNYKVVEELLELGASIEACNSTLKGKGWKAQDLLPGVTPVHDGYTRLIDLQQRGYAYIRF